MGTDTNLLPRFVPLRLFPQATRADAEHRIQRSKSKVLTIDYPLAAVRALAKLPPLFNLVYVLGEGVCH